MRLLQTMLMFRHKQRLKLSLLPTWQPDLKVWHRTAYHLVQMVRASTGSLTSSRIVLLGVYLRHLQAIYRCQGKVGVVLRTKTYSVMLMQASPGSRLMPQSRSIAKVAVSVRGGNIPSVIPLQQRIAIRAGDLSVIRFWNTLFGIYRILEIKGTLKLGTITSPGVELPQTLMKSFARFCFVFLRNVSIFAKMDLIRRDPKSTLYSPSPSPLTSASANSGPQQTSFQSRMQSCIDWCSRGKKGQLYKYLMSAYGQPVFGRSYSCDTPYGCCASNFGDLIMHRLKITGDRHAFGRLALKNEPAGKIRVFALVDYWTQITLRPLHDFLFDILRVIPQDGTFDQHRPVRDLINRLPHKQVIYSYDLSAATDRLPVVLQETLLSKVFNASFARSWKNLLVDRDYVLSVNKKENLTLRYAVGQPMGALSSWAMLAFIHHALVQFAAYRSGGLPSGSWFTDYAVLGDDVVIANDAVASSYKELMTTIGVEIGLAKSLICANHTVEFAKVLYVSGKPVSGLQWKLFSAAQNNLSVAVNMLRIENSLGTDISPSQVAYIFGASWRQASLAGQSLSLLSERLRRLLVVCALPTSQTSFSRPWTEWMSMVSARRQDKRNVDLTTVPRDVGIRSLRLDLIRSIVRSTIEALEHQRLRVLKQTEELVLQLPPCECFMTHAAREWNSQSLSAIKILKKIDSAFTLAPSKEPWFKWGAPRLATAQQQSDLLQITLNQIADVVACLGPHPLDLKRSDGEGFAILAPLWAKIWHKSSNNIDLSDLDLLTLDPQILSEAQQLRINLMSTINTPWQNHRATAFAYRPVVKYRAPFWSQPKGGWFVGPIDHTIANRYTRHNASDSPDPR